MYTHKKKSMFVRFNVDSVGTEQFSLVERSYKRGEVNDRQILLYPCVVVLLRQNIRFGSIIFYRDVDAIHSNKSGGAVFRGV